MISIPVQIQATLIPSYLAQMAIKRILVKQKIPTVKIADLIEIAAKPWGGEQECAVFGGPPNQNIRIEL